MPSHRPIFGFVQFKDDRSQHLNKHKQISKIPTLTWPEATLTVSLETNISTLRERIFVSTLAKSKLQSHVHAKETYIIRNTYAHIGLTGIIQNLK